ncbi:MAG: UDP-N-acetylmuramate:L-alanyl-gamma-D-glutamyl-meso-diaminopimelate ligase [Burkholderiaceae bacterium]
MARIHILGICGTFMGGVAAIAREAGHQVTGCDTNVYPPMSDQLRALGIDLIEGFGADQLALAPDVWIVGNVVSRGNPLMEAILDAGLPYVSGPQWLAEQVLAGRHVLAVAGTHGKTTTTSMLVHLLDEAGLAPGYLIGGVPGDGRPSARLGAGPRSPFVIEADEYDTAFFDKRSKFVHYRPRTAILNNLEFDHADIFADLGQIQTQFHHLVRMIPRSGLIVRPRASAELDQVLAKGCWTPVCTFGEQADWSARLDGDGSFEVVAHGDVRGRARLSLPGAHNRANALAAMAAAQAVGVRPEQAVDAIGRFAGVRRRLEVRGREAGVTVIDDFAHHPSAMRASLSALRETDAQGRIIAVFEPRSNTMRAGVLNGDLAASLTQADIVLCLAQGLGWQPEPVLAPLRAHAELVIAADLDALVTAALERARSGDRVLVMSNGGFGGVHDKLLNGLRARAAGTD